MQGALSIREKEILGMEVIEENTCLMKKLYSTVMKPKCAGI